MGAWGEGMQANDTALDAIGEYEDELKKIYRRKRVDVAAAKVREIFDVVSEWRKPWGTLGLADSVLDNGRRDLLSNCRDLLTEAVDVELEPEQLECWTDPQKRRAALLLFKVRLERDLTEEEERALEEQNEGLLSRMFRRLEGDATE